MAVTLDSPNFGLTRVSSGESFSKDGYKFSDKDRQTIDAILKALATHTHNGTVALAAPTLSTTLASSNSGGTLPAGATYYYVVSYLDQFGLETACSPELSVTTTAALVAPGTVNLTASPGGSLPGGLYTYAVTFVQATGESLASATSSVTIDGGTSGNAIILDMPSLPVGATAYRVYRSRPGQSQLYYVTDTTSDPWTDTGVAEDTTKITPAFNTTNAFNSITVTIPGTSAAPGSVPPYVKGWRIYRTQVPSTYTGNNLVHEVVEPTTVGGSDLRNTWVDTGTGLQLGAPQSNNSTFNQPPQLLAGAFAPEQATTNLITNPSFEVDFTSWSTVDSSTPSVTRTQVSSSAVGGSKSMQLVNTRTGDDDYELYSLSISPGTQYAISAYSFVSSGSPLTGGALGNRGLWVTDGASIAATTLDTTSSYYGLYRHIVTITTGSTATTLSIRLYSPQGTVLWDSVQCELGGAATAYCDGSLGLGYAWTGTANASTSTRVYGSTTMTELTILDNLNVGSTITNRVGTLNFGYTPASTGQVNFSTVQGVAWQNAANSGAAGTLKSDASDNVVLNPAAASSFMVKGSASASVDIFRVQNSSATNLAKVDTTGRVGIGMGTTTLGAGLHIMSTAIGQISQVIQAFSGQSADMVQFQNNGGTPQMSFTSAGVLKFAASGLSTTSATGGAATALPALPVGYFTVQDSGGTSRKVPYYA